MDKALINLCRRRARWWLGTAVVAAALLLAVSIVRTALRPAATYTGLALFALVVGLSLFNARKKIPFFPLARASTWMQVHIYAGWLAVLLFCLHTNFRWPQGGFEQLLAGVFLLVAVSGVVGLALTRRLPELLTRSGEALTFERIPEFRAEIRRSVESLVAVADRESVSSTMGDFYLNHLMAYINWRPGLFLHLGMRQRRYREIVAALGSLERYSNPREKEVAAELREWIEAKRNLDTQLFGQRLLKLWLFVHIPASFSLLLLGLVHGLIALRYTSGF
ncbi:MAG: hypothetical protein ABI222_15550 [Opitutaceae bacterium]